MTYSDLEYITLKGLQNKQAQRSVQGRYGYLVVDEFQDTSQVQFKIISSIIGGDMGRLFAVGDVKQAIYRFRGGEVSIFEDCAKNIPRQFELKNNYRSLPCLVEFNNYFFSDIFKLGAGFKGKAKFETQSTAQTIPQEISHDFSGEVISYEVDISKEEEPGISEIESLEARAIFEILKKSKGQTTCILYKKLSPSMELFQLLAKAKMSFCAQVKVPIGEGPILALFYSLVKGYLADGEIDSTFFLVDKLMGQFRAKLQGGEKALEEFYFLVKERGAYYAFCKFLFDQNLSNSQWEENLAFIHSMLELCNDDLERFYQSFGEIREKTFSFEFQTGGSPLGIQIMTAHSAKGLEFEQVILGGIHTNGRQYGGHNIFGKMPGSFCWKKNTLQKKFYKSPLFVFEQLTDRHLDLAEDKRLFYVAATRAQRKLAWINFSGQKVHGQPKRSWIYAFGPDISPKGQGLVSKSPLDLPKQKIPFDKVKRPFLQQNSLGVLPITEKQASKALLLNDLSVTGLACLVSCPRKFYLKNILKISSEDIDGDGQEALSGDRSLESKQLNRHIRSDAERGSMMHSLISQMIKNGGDISPIEETSGGQGLLKWVGKLILPYLNDQLYSERSLKFSLFGATVSGIADLIIQNGRRTLIWDFKTGSKRKDDEEYWGQLKLYALALWQLNKVDKSDPIELSLVYVDEREVLERKVNFEQTRDEFFSLWQLVNSTKEVNRTHCPSCNYGKLCRFEA